MEEGPMKIGVHKVAMAAPNDVSGLAALIDSGEVDPGEVVALIGKTEGNGGANDFTRGYATLSYQLLLGKHLGMSPEKVGARVAFVWSGGTEGVLSPHATVFTRSARTERSGGSAGPRLALAVEATRDIAAEEVGTMAQVREVAAAVRRCLQAAEIRDPADVHYVQVKGPLLTPASIADADRRGAKLVTHDPNGSKVYARGATALGDEDARRVVSIFAKAEATPTVRGRRNTMLSDADINYERHARAAVGAVIASITGDPAIFVSGGTEHQCAPGAAPIAAIVRV